MKRIKTIFNKEYCNLINELSFERKRLGLAQKDVATLMNTTQSEISKIESFERRLDIMEFKKLIEIYRVKDNIKLYKIVTSFLNLEKI